MEDKESNSGPGWVYSPLHFKNSTESMQVTAPRLLSPTDFFVAKAAGMLYCKIISPARVAEWILTDGLKKNYFWAPTE